MKDCCSQIKEAEKELENVLPKIVESIKKELLIRHPISQKSSIKRSDTTQKALDHCNNQINKVFEFERNQIINAPLNDWCSSDSAVTSIFTDATGDNR